MRETLPAPSQELIFLDPDDDLATVRAKLESTPADEIYLVVPRNASILRTPLEFRILGRLAGELSSETVIVSSDNHRRWLARQEGFRTKRSLHQLRHLMSPDGKPGIIGLLFDVLPVPTIGTLVALLTLLGVAGVVLYFVLPEMRVTVTPRTDVLRQDLQVAVDPTALRPDPERLILPGRKVEHRLEVRGTVPTSGTVQVGRTKAIGEVIVINTRDESVTLPQGTIVLTDAGIRFATERELMVPARTRDGIAVGVVALEPGSQGNVPARAITRLEDEQYPGLQVTNRLATSGGTDREGSAVAERDMDALRERLSRQAAEEAGFGLQTAAGPDTVVLEEAVRVSGISEQFDQQVGVPAEQLSGRMTAIVSALAFKREDLSNLATRVLTANVQEPFRSVGDPTLGEIQVIGAEGDSLRLRVEAGAVVAWSLEPSRIEEALRGKSVEEAREILAGLPGMAAPPRLELWPEWSPRAYRVAVDVATPR